ncbi:hypothetical protein GCM10010145_46750 [Streptomyces ruber]|uniref:Uncharacterized protein n=2 Tax=Streptomyces TaxID=1883 RepID=A0A918BIJ0_9ACTN|nr:hypothetical protein [Streptomyces ruber]GGQ71859.1 hypothetical protein GCM10010145_46750 [Streptomyces ruber]
MSPVVTKVNENAQINSLAMLSSHAKEGEVVVGAWPAAVMDGVMGALGCAPAVANEVGKAVYAAVG